MAPLALAYDAINALLWLPTGSRGLREQLVESLELQPGERVLELGCGTGQVTERLLLHGAAVVAVDRSHAMLDRARERAPGARFVKGDVVEAAVEGPFDAVVLAFLLHELADTDARVAVLVRARELLASNGRVAILDWSLPSAAWASATWRRVVGVIEPNGATDVLDGCVPNDVEAAGLTLVRASPVVNGRASIWIAARR